MKAELMRSTLVCGVMFKGRKGSTRPRANTQKRRTREREYTHTKNTHADMFAPSILYMYIRAPAGQKWSTHTYTHTQKRTPKIYQHKEWVGCTAALPALQEQILVPVSQPARINLNVLSSAAAPASAKQTRDRHDQTESEGTEEQKNNHKLWRPLVGVLTRRLLLGVLQHVRPICGDDGHTPFFCLFERQPPQRAFIPKPQNNVGQY